MKEFELIPYIEIDGIRTFTDSDILNIYDRIIDEGKEHIFKDGTIRDGCMFLEIMKNSNTVFYVIYYKKELLGIVWLNRFEGRLARMHWCTFGGISIEAKIRAGCYVNQELMTTKDTKGNYVFDLLLGYIPVSNNEAIQFVQCCGGVVSGTIPNLIWNNEKGESESGIISYYSRQQMEASGCNENI